MHRFKNLLLALLIVSGVVPIFAQIPYSAGVGDAGGDKIPPTGVYGLPEGQMTTTVTGARATLGPGDLVQVTVFGVPDLTQRARVNMDGLLHLALIGDIAVNGQTPERVRERITSKLVEGNFVKKPQVELFILEYSGQMAYVTGEVSHPGAYSLLRSHRLSDLIAMAGGLTPRAGTHVTIVRDGEAKNTMRVDLADKDRAQANPEIEPGDLIDIELTGIVYVLGNVGHPGGFLLDRRTSLSFVEALALAEGPAHDGSMTNAILIHSAQPNPQPIKVNLKSILKSHDSDIRLQAGDIIWVGDSAFRNLGRLAIATILATASGVAVYSSYLR